MCFGKWGTCEIVEISFKDHAVGVAMGREKLVIGVWSGVKVAIASVMKNYMFRS